MSLSSINLDAFFEVCRTRHFSKAALNLHVTQSALSQRIQNLEETLLTTLLVRDRKGIRLTESGERLLRYCQMRERLEEEAIGDLEIPNQKKLRGVLRIGAYSSVLRSILMPALSPFLLEHQSVQCSFEAYEMQELEGVLLRGDADLVVVDFESKRHGLRSEVLGQEEYVLIERRAPTPRRETYLDHDPSDQATFEFFRMQGKRTPDLSRAFMGDVYGVLDGVKLGLGRAVMSKHLLKGDRELRMVPGLKSRRVDVRLTYFEQPYYSKLQERVMAELKQQAAKYF